MAPPDPSDSQQGWTVHTLYVHLIALLGEATLRNEQRFVAQEKAVTAALTAADRAVAKSEIASEKRFDATNEFRGQLADQAQTFMPRKEAEQGMKSNADRIDAVITRLDRMEGQSAGSSTAIAYVIGGIGVLGTIVAIAVAVLSK